MIEVRETAFDKLAFNYDRLWSTSAAGIAQRLAVWRYVDSLFREGEMVLDLGCGTGIDALHLQASGVSIYGIDSSPKMIEVARRRGIDAHCFRIEDLHLLDILVDGVISNFGALNCVASLSSVASDLARMVRPGGRVALCFLGRLCLWEAAYFLLRANPRKAFRRLRGWADSSFGARAFYPTSGAIVSAFQSDFRLLESCGIGLFVPPSYVAALTDWEIEQLSKVDRRLAHQTALRPFADHHLYIFERI